MSQPDLSKQVINTVLRYFLFFSKEAIYIKHGKKQTIAKANVNIKNTGNPLSTHVWFSSVCFSYIFGQTTHSTDTAQSIIVSQ